MPETLASVKRAALEALISEFGHPTRDTVKVAAWEFGPSVSVVLQKDQPNRSNWAHLWMPHPGDGKTVPEEAVEYPGESGRHSNTYPSPGLERGKPVLRLTIHSIARVPALIADIRAMKDCTLLPDLPKPQSNGGVAAGAMEPFVVDVGSMPSAPKPKPRREAIPKIVQHEVWQRDGGRCTDCGSKERLCFDHIVPFSRGGGNSVRNIQLLCERCNLSKGNQI